MLRRITVALIGLLAVVNGSKWLFDGKRLPTLGIGQTPTFGIILKTNEKLIKIWNELLLVGFSETNKFDQKQFG